MGVIGRRNGKSVMLSKAVHKQLRRLKLENDERSINDFLEHLLDMEEFVEVEK